MTVFDKYSVYYDALYQDKNYSAEADYVLDSISRYVKPVSILDLGCGTGLHAVNMIKKGCECTGCDMSDSMLKTATANAEKADINCLFIKENALTLNLKRKYSAVTALFHVVSYQNANDDVEAILATASKHLDIGGIFMFDVWYGPAVLSQKPENKIKKMSSEEYEITRYARPELNFRQNTVNVNYHVLINDKNGNKPSEIKETHKMRYFFEPEIALFAEKAGFIILNAEEWMTKSELSERTWSAAFILQKVED